MKINPDLEKRENQSRALENQSRAWENQSRAWENQSRSGKISPELGKNVPEGQNSIAADLTGTSGAGVGALFVATLHVFRRNAAWQEARLCSLCVEVMQAPEAGR